MIHFHVILRDLLDRLRGSRAAAFVPRASPPPPPAPIQPRPPRFPQKPPVRLPPLPPIAPPPPLPSGELYPRMSTTWGLDGGFAPTTSGFETRVFDPPRTAPKAQPQVRAFSIFDDLFDD